MKQLSVILMILAFFAQVLLAQPEKSDKPAKDKPAKAEKALPKDKAADKKMPMQEMKTDAPAEEMAPPAPLNDPWTKWMVGEWEGESESDAGKTKEWMKVEMALGDQFYVLHLNSTMTSISDEGLKMWNMTREQAEEMMKMPYQGMGMFTFDPKTGETIGYWFDSWRGAYQGRGTLEGNKETSNWSGPMGTSVRTTEKINENEMRMTFKETMLDGKVAEGSGTMRRKK